jgi:hypothetical protein
MVMDREEAVLIVCKAGQLSWSATRAVLSLCAGGGGIAAARLEKIRAAYNNMKRETALQVVKYQRENR